MHKNNIEDNPEFKKHFWEWFDNLSADQKKKFWYYRLDMAAVNFYNTAYNK